MACSAWGNLSCTNAFSRTAFPSEDFEDCSLSPSATTLNLGFSFFACDEAIMYVKKLIREGLSVVAGLLCVECRLLKSLQDDALKLELDVRDILSFGRAASVSCKTLESSWPVKSCCRSALFSWVSPPLFTKACATSQVLSALSIGELPNKPTRRAS
jgi:hypothetical protein